MNALTGPRGRHGRDGNASATGCVAETREPVEVGWDAVDVVLSPPRRAEEGHADGGADMDRGRVLLHIEQIDAGPSRGAYDVFLNPPADRGPDPGDDWLAGRIALFGSAHGGSSSKTGFQFVLDITGLVAALARRGAWRDDRIRLRIVPVPPAIGPIRIGRASISRR